MNTEESRVGQDKATLDRNFKSQRTPFMEISSHILLLCLLFDSTKTILYLYLSSVGVPIDLTTIFPL